MNSRSEPTGTIIGYESPSVGMGDLGRVARRLGFACLSAGGLAGTPVQSDSTDITARESPETVRRSWVPARTPRVSLGSRRVSEPDAVGQAADANPTCWHGCVQLGVIHVTLSGDVTDITSEGVVWVGRAAI